MADDSKKWPPEAIRALIQVLRAYCHLEADFRTVAAMLHSFELLHQAPKDWMDDLNQARQTDEYRKISEQLEPEFRALEQSLDESELARLLASVQSKGLLN